MRRHAIAALAVGASLLLPLPASAHAPAAAASGDLQHAQADLSATQSLVARLHSELAGATLRVAAADQRAAADRPRELDLRRRAGAAARREYQTRASRLSALLEQRGAVQVWNTAAEGRLVAERERALVDELDRLTAADEAASAAAHARRDSLQGQLDQAEARLQALAARVGAGAWSGLILAMRPGSVPGARLPQTTGDAGQCTWYAEQAWVTYSDPASPRLDGDGGYVVGNLASATGRPVEPTPQPGSLVSWMPPLMSRYGHVAYVASVDRVGGAMLGYTVWEMNYTAPYATDARYVPWTGTDPRVVFLSPPKPVDPLLLAQERA